MSTLSSHRLPPANGHNGDNHGSALGPLPGGDAGTDGPDDWAEDEALRRELDLLAAEHKELLSSAGLAGQAEPAEPAGLDEGGPDARELGQVRAENARLRARVEELEQLLLAAGQGREQTWSEQQREYEALLEEKSEVIRGLYVKIQDQRHAAEAAPPSSAEAGDAAGRAPVVKGELEALRQELERQRCQLREDEEALEEQMKHMELAMSRERVEVARQRAEVQRLQNDFQHELETAARDEKLRERLLPLQRRHQDAMNSKGSATGPAARPATTAQLQRPATVPNLAAPGHATPAPAPRKAGSGLLRRLFGGREQ